MRDFLIVRGDLSSHTGYSKALRSIAALMRPHFEQILGVDLHYSTAKSTVPFPYYVADHRQAGKLLRREDVNGTVLHFTTPDGFAPYRSAYNIGYFFWETDRFRPDLFWRDAILAMDEMWTPNQFMADLLRAQGYGGRLKVISWPQDFTESACMAEQCTVVAECLGSPAGDQGGSLQPTAKLRAEFSPIFLGIATDVARKGLPILLSEWCEYLSIRKKRSLLLLKISSIDVTKTTERLRDDIQQMVAPFWKSSLGPLDIALITGALSESELNALYAMSDVYVSASLGEGFGGPVVECLLNNTLYISPRHTSLTELIPPGYPFIVETEAASVILRDNVPVYSPSSTWHIVKRGATARAMREYEDFPPEQRQDLIRRARAYAAELCAVAHVRTAVEGACYEIIQAALTKKANSFAMTQASNLPLSAQEL